MPLPSRYLWSSRQISRFPKLQGKENGPRQSGHAAGDGQGRELGLGCQPVDEAFGSLLSRPLPEDLRPLAAAGRRPSRFGSVSLPAETVEFPVPYAAEKGMPLVRREPEDRPCGVPAVANADLATGQARHLDTIAVGVTQRALNPVKTGTPPFVRTPERSASHVTPSLVGVFS